MVSSGRSVLYRGNDSGSQCYICMKECLYVCLYEWMSVCINECVNVCKFICMCAWMSMCVCMLNVGMLDGVYMIDGICMYVGSIRPVLFWTF